MPSPRFNIKQLVCVPDNICPGRLGSVVQIEYQPPTHGPLAVPLLGVDCSSYVYRLSLHGGQTIFVSEKQLLSWNPSRVEKLQTPAPPMDLQG